MDPTPPLIAGRPLEYVITHLEAAIAAQYGVRSGFHTALAGRCFLACATLARWADENGGRADLVCGQMFAGNPDNADAYGVHITMHAWLVIDGWLVDPTIVQAEREQFGGPLANLGPILCVPVPTGRDATRDRCRFVDPKRDLELVFEPERRPERLARYRSLPDMQPYRSRRLIRALQSTLAAQTTR